MKIGEAHPELIKAGLEIYEQSKQENDIGIDTNYRMSLESPLRKYFPAEYRQVLIQRPQSDGNFEEDYTVDQYPQMISLIKESLPGIEFYRARLAILPPGFSLDWHIDTDTSVSCRIQILLKGSMMWKIRKKDKVEEMQMEPGAVWFTNTGYEHRVDNVGNEDRVVLTVGCKSKFLVPYLKPEVEP